MEDEAIRLEPLRTLESLSTRGVFSTPSARFRERGLNPGKEVVYLNDGSRTDFCGIFHIDESVAGD